MIVSEFGTKTEWKLLNTMVGIFYNIPTFSKFLHYWTYETPADDFSSFKKYLEHLTDLKNQAKNILASTQTSWIENPG